MRRCLTALVIALVMVGCGDSGPTAAEDAATTVTRPILAGQKALLATTAKKTNRVVLYVHGNNDLADSVLEDPRKADVIAALLRDGYAIAASDAHGNSWGNPAGVRSYVALVDWLRQRGYSDVYVLAQSAGGLTALTLIDRVRVKAWAGLFPACNLGALHARGRYTDAIDKAWPDGWRPGPVRPRDVKDLTMIFWASPSDTRVPKASNTDVCAANARADGARVTVVATVGEHGDPSNFDQERLLAFYRRAGVRRHQPPA